MLQPQHNPELNQRYFLTYAIIFAIGLPIFFLFGQAAVDGHRRFKETPLRAILGNERFEALSRGENGFPHYLGQRFRAPDFSLRNRFGRTWKLSEHRNHVVVMNFWSITCPPCLQELPTIEDLAHITQNWGDVDVIAISTDPDWQQVIPLIPAQARVQYLLDPNKAVTQGRYGTRLYPETWVIDKEGIIRLRYDGARDWSEPTIINFLDSLR